MIEAKYRNLCQKSAEINNFVVFFKNWPKLMQKQAEKLNFLH